MNQTVKPNVVIIGLDCLAPELLFHRWLDQLPTFADLMTSGTWGPLMSVDPPITIPAWSCMMSGYNPAQLGLYGFRHRRLGSYDDRYLAFSTEVKKPRAWDHLNERGLSSGLLGVPQTYPPKPINGYMVSGFLAPSNESIYTYPDPIRDEIEDLVGDYRLDVENFRSNDKERIKNEIHEMTCQRFEIFEHLIKTRPTDFAMMVEIGPDRMHHAFWRYCDPDHRLYEKDNPFQNVILDYYKLLDDKIKHLLDTLDPNTHVFIVSDHGAQPMQGGFCINDWLRKQGLLTLKKQPETQTRFDESMVDWAATKAWAWGGYYARIFINLQGREPQGRVLPERYEALMEEISSKLQIVSRENETTTMGNKVFRPSDMTKDQMANGDYPDLMLYPGNLGYRAIGSVGNPGIFVEQNDTGPDDANHAKEGVFIYRGPASRQIKDSGPREDLRLVDIGPTVLRLFDINPPADAVGRPMYLSL